MGIKMAGIDYRSAAIEIREKFALTSASAAELLKKAGRAEGVSGCAVINTCNRMELWLSCREEEAVSPYEEICAFFGFDPAAYEGCFARRSGKEAVLHLFELACGLKSMIFGEEQILGQVKEAIGFARDCGASDAELEALFRGAVTAAKKAKTEVRLPFVSRSVASAAVVFLKELIGDLKGLPCLVIGSGEMGRLAAKGLLAEGCEVAMTLRRYKSGDSIVPAGCKAIDYEDRYRKLFESKIIISATRSPHHTLEHDILSKHRFCEEKIMFDLALPRDIDPRIGSLPNVRLYDIDRLGGRLADGEDREKLARIEKIISEEIGEYERWSRMRTLIPKISEISASACADVEGRLRSGLKRAGLDEAVLKLVREAAGRAVSKVVESMLLSLYKEEGEAPPPELLSEMKKESLGSSPEGKKAGLLRFPLFVDLSGRKVAVIGAGNVALRRVTALLAYPCRIIVTAPEAREEILALHERGMLKYVQKEYEPSDLDGAYLVIAATGSREVNRRAAEDARRAGIYCSAADCREECTFYFPATVRYEGGVIGICGTGENHGLTRQIAAEIREFVKAREGYI